ncbi:MAG TPA: DUF4214 domain-containing protein [Burkholderiaceae bacterium]
MNNKKTVVACVFAALLGSACGGTSIPDGGAAGVQSKQIDRTRKSAAANYQLVVQQLYVSYFGRPADPAGLVNFENALAATNAPTDIEGVATEYATNPALKSLVDSFGISNESKSFYGTGTTTAFVTAVFQNTLNRSPQTAGLDFWINAINSGQLSQGDAALSIMAGALGNTTAQGKLDAQLISNRLSIASYFTSQVSAFGLVGKYSGASAASNARTLLSAVTATTNISSYQANASAAAAAMTGPGPVTELLAGAMGGPGDMDGTTANARFNQPQGVACDSQGNIYVADSLNNTIRKIAANGTVSTFVGSPGVAGATDGNAATALFSFPTSLAVDPAGNLFVSDTGNDTIRKVTPSGIVSTVAGQAGLRGYADGAGAAATFNYLGGITIDGAGNLLVIDTFAVRKITPSGSVTTFAGATNVNGDVDGTGTAARFHYLGAIAIDKSGNFYVTDTVSNDVRKITPAAVVTTLAGLAGTGGSADGTGSAARFAYPYGVAADAAGNVYVSERSNDLIRKITPAGVVTRFSGVIPLVQDSADGGLNAASFNQPAGICFDPAGNLLVADTGNSLIRKISPASDVTTVAGVRPNAAHVDGAGASARFNGPGNMTTDNVGNIYVTEFDYTIAKVTPAGIVTTFAGDVGVNGALDGTGTAARFNGVAGVVGDAFGNIFLTDSGNDVVRKIDSNGVVSTLAGTFGATGSTNGVGQAARFSSLGGITIDSNGNLYVADTYNAQIRKITPDGSVSTYAGSFEQLNPTNGFRTSATFFQPRAIVADLAGNIYVSDGNNTVRKIDASGNVTTVAGAAGVEGYADGPGSSALFNSPGDLCADAKGNIYVVDYLNLVVRKISPDGVVSTIAGIVNRGGFSVGTSPTYLGRPRGIAIYGTTLYVSTENGIAAIYNLAAT